MPLFYLGCFMECSQLCLARNTSSQFQRSYNYGISNSAFTGRWKPFSSNNRFMIMNYIIFQLSPNSITSHKHYFLLHCQLLIFWHAITSLDNHAATIWMKSHINLVQNHWISHKNFFTLIGLRPAREPIVRKTGSPGFSMLHSALNVSKRILN